VTATCLADRTAPGELLRMVADGLTGAGLDMRAPGDGEGHLTWTRDYWAEAAAIVSAPEPWGQVADPASVASSVVEAGRLGHG
jgi:hypothetical protein